VHTESYELEYGVDAMEVHTDAISPGDRVLLVDDLIATGGTALAALKLLRKAGAKVAGAAFLVCLPELQGDTRLSEAGVDVSYLVWFAGR
jgi:adenine phosphoribosyltransferase